MKYKKIVVFGAGSIGCHYTRAAIVNGIENVTVVDLDPDALVRFPEIYKSRYQTVLPDTVTLMQSESSFFEDINDTFFVIGTPPDTRHSVLMRIKTGASVLLEKPLCDPHSWEGVRNVLGHYHAFDGYNHARSKSFRALLSALEKHSDRISSITVTWRESWAGPLSAHPWLADAYASYLGFTARGGGALFEHSHGLHLLHFLLAELGDNIDRLDLKSFKVCEKKLHDTDVHLGGLSVKGIDLTVVTSVLGDEAEKSLLAIMKDGTQMRLSMSAGIDILAIDGREDLKFSKRREDDFNGYFAEILASSGASNKTFEPSVKCQEFLCRLYHANINKLD